jgi:hypothetical protein
MANQKLILRRGGACVLDMALLFAVLAPIAFLLRALRISPATGLQIWGCCC